jgi:hypothetical protein
MNNRAPAKTASHTVNIVKRHKDALGKWHQIPKETWDAVIASMGEPEEATEAVLVVRRGQRKKLRAPALTRLIRYKKTLRLCVRGRESENAMRVPSSQNYLGSYILFVL